jgi:hypothetical protein
MTRSLIIVLFTFNCANALEKYAIIRPFSNSVVSIEKRSYARWLPQTEWMPLNSGLVWYLIRPQLVGSKLAVVRGSLLGMLFRREENMACRILSDRYDYHRRMLGGMVTLRTCGAQTRPEKF